MLIVQTKLKNLAKEEDLRLSKEFLDALNEHVENQLKQAMGKTTRAKRKTVRKDDL